MDLSRSDLESVKTQAENLIKQASIEILVNESIIETVDKRLKDMPESEE